MSEFRTFALPESVSGAASDTALAREMIAAWRADGIFQIAADPDQSRKTAKALEASRRFFAMPMDSKSRNVSDLTFSGYIASGEEITAGRPIIRRSSPSARTSRRTMPGCGRAGPATVRSPGRVPSTGSTCKRSWTASPPTAKGC
ncbi:2-oxoglutarate and iron-dependent oxygenase domain-containing protein [Allosalinactinospora lopnorensis]|uniref:2-oxoglutarate and iron-dependent oxygenase domain-containing protein n=1 Tax=Allosalinactinospora lopnorensis TaxID=1352348 RepID=UPI00191BFA60